MSRLVRFAVAIVTGWAASNLIVWVAYAVGLWAGGHADLLWLTVRLSLPFGVVLGVFAALWPFPVRVQRGRIAIAAAIAGAALGCLYWYLSQRVLALYFWGQWAGLGLLDFDLEATSCWTAAGASAMLCAVTNRSRGALAATALLCFLAVVVPAPVFNHVAQNQELTVAFVAPQEATSAPIELPKVITAGDTKKFEVEKATNRVLQSLRSAGVQGKYQVVYLYREGKGKESLAIIVVNTAVTSPALLAEPNGTEVIYVQKAEEWAKIPPQAPTLNRNIKIWERGAQRDYLAHFEISGPSGFGIIDRVPKPGAGR